MSEANSSPGDGPSGPSHSAPAPISHDDSSEDNGNENALFANAKTGRTPSEDGDRPNENASDGDGDAGLFGSEPEDEGTGALRKLSDSELDSGDDDARYDRVVDTVEVDQGIDDPDRDKYNVMDTDIPRVAYPEPGDGELYTLNLPDFLGIETEEFDHDTYNPPIAEHHSTHPAKASFSPFNTAATSLCWRFLPDSSDVHDLQANARIIRWSNGQLTLQLASNPREHYKIPAKPLAPPQFNPVKPTPTGILRPRGSISHESYTADKDSNTYLMAPLEATSLWRIVSPLTTSLTIQPYTANDENDEAVLMLQKSLAAAVKSVKTNADGSIAMLDVNEDPELAKKRAEKAEKEREAARRKTEAFAERNLARDSRVLGRSGLGRMGRAGLTIGDLEGDGMATTKARSKPKRKPNRRGEIYSDEEEDYGRRRTKEDEYDEEDGFLVGSDEEPEMVEDDDDEEEDGDADLDAEGEDDDMAVVEKAAPVARKERQVTPKRDAEAMERDDTAEPPASGSPHTRKKHRYRVEDEDEE